METITAKNVIEFSRTKETSRKNFVQKLQNVEPPPQAEGGGNYWVSCLSAINNGFKKSDSGLILEKIHEIEYKRENTNSDQTKNMYDRNISILYKFEDYNFGDLRPCEDISIQKNTRKKEIVDIDGVDIKVSPSCVFTFGNEEKQVGAIWFIAKKESYSKEELAMFADMLQRYLVFNYSKTYNVNFDFCIVFDVCRLEKLNYSEVIKNGLESKLDPILKEIKQAIHN